MIVNSMSKAFSYQDLPNGDIMCPSSGAKSQKNTPGQIGLKFTNTEFAGENKRFTDKNYVYCR